MVYLPIAIRLVDWRVRSVWHIEVKIDLTLVVVFLLHLLVPWIIYGGHRAVLDGLKYSWANLDHLRIGWSIRLVRGAV